MTQERIALNYSSQYTQVLTAWGLGPGLPAGPSAWPSDCLCPDSCLLCLRLTSHLHPPCCTEMLLPVAG